MTKTEYIDLLTEIEFLKLAIKLEVCCDIIEVLQEELVCLKEQL